MMGSASALRDGAGLIVWCLVSYLPSQRLRDTDLQSECDSLADGDKRRLREDGKQCECKEGWAGINCNGMQPPSCFEASTRVNAPF